MPKPCRVKITVLKRMFNADLVSEYLETDPGYGPCDQVREGQEFFVESPWSKPQGMCTWAWADIRNDITLIASGANPHWIKLPGTVIASCSDCFRPVIFKIERID